MAQSLRVALVWRGTIIQETVTKNGRVTIGGGEHAVFQVPLDDDDECHVLFEVQDESAVLNVPAGMTVVMGAENAQSNGPCGEMKIRPGDAGMVRARDLAFFFQWVHDEESFVPAAFRDATNWSLAGSLIVSGAINLLTLLFGILSYQPEVAPRPVQLPTRPFQIIVQEPPGETETAVEEQLVLAESTSRAADGEEGKFGSPESASEESVLPSHDGPAVNALMAPELGMAFQAAVGQTGALSSVFGASDSFSNTFGADFATSGEGDSMVVGRGDAGMSNRGRGPGGGGTGFGRVGGVGELDTGGGPGTGAAIGRRESQVLRGRVTLHAVSVNGFLSKQQIENVVRRHSRGIQYCYERELATDAALGGRISANWTIGLSGTVERVSISENNMNNATVEACIVRELRRMRFDPPDGGMVVVTYPFSFRSEAG